MDYAQAERDILDRLAPYKVAGIDLQVMPEAEADFKRPFKNGRIYCGYKGSKYKDPNSTAEMSQDEEVLFEFSFQSRTLRGDIGIYTLLALTVQALVGFKPTSCDKMYCKESGYTVLNSVHVDGVWTFTMVMACRSVSVEDFEEDLTVIMRKFTNIFKGDFSGDNFDTPNEITTPIFEPEET